MPEDEWHITAHRKSLLYVNIPDRIHVLDLACPPVQLTHFLISKIISQKLEIMDSMHEATYSELEFS